MPIEAKDIFEANSSNVRTMLSERGLGLYIPPYQRPYGWDKEKVAKLLEDILHGYTSLVDSKDSFTFLGTVITIHDIHFSTVQPIVRQEVPAKVLTVIDGQQRLTSLLLLCVALHSQIRLHHSKLFNGREQPSLTEAEKWIEGQSKRVVDELAATFIEKQSYGDSPIYPRMIRSFLDQWSRQKAAARYTSPIANLVFSYSNVFESEKPAEFRPKKRDGQIEGEEALIARFLQITKTLKDIASEKDRVHLDEIPSFSQMTASKEFQLALLNHEFPDVVSQLVQGSGSAASFKSLLHLVLLASYVLYRVAVTVVRGKNEDYAFTVFESLNTTGEPLTAFETFKPKVVSAEGLENYEQSEARKRLDEVSDYLSVFKVGENLQAATRDLLTYFALAETGEKLSKRLADQRRYLKDEFERYESNPNSRLAFVQSLRDVASFVQHSWELNDGSVPTLSGLPVSANTDAIKLCLSLLTDLGHTVTIAPLVRFYSAAVNAGSEESPERIRDFEFAIKAVTAFSVLWRASRRNTGNIDSEYRQIMSGTESVTNLGAVARSLRRGAGADARAPALDVAGLKSELRARLREQKRGDIANRAAFVANARSLDIYKISRAIARFVLLAAYHDAIEDENYPGLIVKGKMAVSPCLTFDGYRDKRHLSLEHIAPQDPANGWEDSIWGSKDTPHTLGNLVLVRPEANSMLSNRPWEQKRVLYAALGARSHDEAGRTLAAAGFEFGESTQSIVQLSSHMPHLRAVSRADKWDVSLISQRSERLLELAYDELYSWLT